MEIYAAVYGRQCGDGDGVSPTGENVVGKDNYMINRDTVKDIPTEQWVECGLPAFRRITMPPSTAEGYQAVDEDGSCRAEQR